jgi:hypothetical protein
MNNAPSRREVLSGAAAVVAAAALPAVPRGDATAEKIRAIVMEIRASNMLTPAQIAALRQRAKETHAYARKVYPGLR